MRVTLFVIGIFFITITYAQEFNVKYIPDSLTGNANVVKRYEEMILEIKSPGKYVWHERHVYTILNESGNDFATYKSYYDRFNTIDYASALLYDENGRELKRVKKKDMPDFAAGDGLSLMEDDRYIINNFADRSYPYTVDYEEDDTKEGVLSFQGWQPVQAANMSVMYSKYIIIAPSDYQVRYHEFNFAAPPLITEKGNKKTYTWEIRNVQAEKAEIMAPLAITTPCMMVAPSDFEAQGYQGNMSDWTNYGKFIYTLKKGRDNLPEDIKKQVHDLTDNVKDVKQKINILYEFLQKNTHYISIQLGIGGWQPFDATYVATKKYGDCKALSNYMIALLKEAGITGKYVEIRAEENAFPIIKEFSESQFNHVICCVPLKKDTVWLECTSEDKPAGYLGGFTADRWGVLIDENGGTLVHTPKYGYKDNIVSKKIIANVNNEGTIAASVEINYKAKEQDDFSMLLCDHDIDKAEDYLKKSIYLPTYDLQNVRFTESKKLLPSVTATMNITAANYAQLTGKRFFINPNILSKSDERLAEDTDRKLDVELHAEYTYIDTVAIKIPYGYKPESIFQDVNIQSKFGTYLMALQIMPDSICYIRKLVRYSGRFPAADYTELVDFYNKIFKADHKLLVFARKE